MSDIANTLRKEMSDIKPPKDFDLYKVISINEEEIVSEILHSIVVHDNGNAYYFMKEEDIPKNLNYLFDDPTVLRNYTNWKCKEKQYLKLLENNYIVIEPYHIKPIEPDNIINPIF